MSGQPCEGSFAARSPPQGVHSHRFAGAQRLKKALLGPESRCMPPEDLTPLCLLLALLSIGLALFARVMQRRVAELRGRLRESERLRFELLRQNNELRSRSSAPPTATPAQTAPDSAHSDSLAAEPSDSEPQDLADVDFPRWDDTRPVSSLLEPSIFPATQPNPLHLRPDG